jgi:AcrR family transcriptional regulator
MQVITCMQGNREAPVKSTPARERILVAAAKVFARDGLAGATTRAIAKAAKVNEVTLFRHFGTKERLTAAVIGKTFTHEQAEVAADSADLHADLMDYARRYDAQLTANLPLIRTVLAEIHRHRDYEHQVLHAIFRPMRVSLIERLERADLRPGVTPAIAADLFASMIFTAVLKRSKPMSAPEYSLDQYRDAAVAVLIGGITVRDLS